MLCHDRGLDVAPGGGNVGDERDEHDEGDRADRPVSEAEAAVGRLAEAVREGGAEGPGHDVGEPNAKIGLSLKRAQPTAGMEMITANSSAEPKKPRFNDSAVRSPAAVPRANVESTAAQ